jgi:hypothetical protein
MARSGDRRVPRKTAELLCLLCDSSPATVAQWTVESELVNKFDHADIANTDPAAPARFLAAGPLEVGTSCKSNFSAGPIRKQSHQARLSLRSQLRLSRFPGRRSTEQVLKLAPPPWLCSLDAPQRQGCWTPLALREMSDRLLMSEAAEHNAEHQP